MKILVIDGQGGKMGATIVEQLQRQLPHLPITAIGTNSMATAAMLKAGASAAATGENPVIVHCRDADVIIGPIGILVADALMGEITPRMARSIGQSRAHRILIPVNRCNTMITGVENLTLTEHVRRTLDAVNEILSQ